MMCKISVIKQVILVFLLLVLSFVSADAQRHTVGLLAYDSTSFLGYTLFAPLSYNTTYLIDNYGRIVNFWESNYRPGLSCYFLENGHLLRTARVVPQGGGAGGAVEEMDWEGNLVWRFDYHSDDYLQHHDAEYLPNGNVLLLAWEHKTEAEVIAYGRRPDLIEDHKLSPEHVVEVKPQGLLGGEIVWEWHLWDHLIQDYDSTKDNYGVVGEHPELVDINFSPWGARPDWVHANAVDYNSELDQIIISCRNLNEIWIIDHSTNTEEAAGHTGGNSGMGGDILWRWGNPQAYRAGELADQRLFGQHDAQWIESGLSGEGNVLVFNNGIDRPGGGYSSVEEIMTPVDENGRYPQPSPGTPHGPGAPVWIYASDPVTDFWSPFISGAQRLPNGHTLICSGNQGALFEVTPGGETVWRYISPITSVIVPQGYIIGFKQNPVFRCYRYAPDYPGLEGCDLTPGGPIETYPISISTTMHFPSNPSVFESVVVNTKVVDEIEITLVELRFSIGSGFSAIPMLDDGNHHDGSAGDDVYGAVIPPQLKGTSVSYYVYAENGPTERTSDPPYAPIITYGYVVHELKVLINEFMVENEGTIQDEAGDYDSWLELYNPHPGAISLEGMYLSDDYSDSLRWPIPDTVIPPKEHLLFWADGEEDEGPLHTNFTLDQGGGGIGLFEIESEEVVALEWMVYEAQHPDTSFGRCPDGGLDWRLFLWGDASPSSANYVCGDANADCGTRLWDAIYLANYKFKNGAPPTDPICRANPNGDGIVDLSDVLYIANYFLKAGPAPKDCENYSP